MEEGESILFPIAFLSLFVLSAAVMSYLFFYQPVMMYLDGDRRGGATLFVRTVLAFAIYTAIILISVFTAVYSFIV